MTSIYRVAHATKSTTLEAPERSHLGMQCRCTVQRQVNWLRRHARLGTLSRYVQQRPILQAQLLHPILAKPDHVPCAKLERMRHADKAK